MHPKARALVRRLQPFYRKRSPGPHRKNPLWILDELRNLDRPRRLHVTPVAPERTVTDLTLHNPSVSVLRTHSVRKAPKNGAVVERIWLSPEAKESDVSVKSVPSCKLAWDEPQAFQRRSPLNLSLEAASQAPGGPPWTRSLTVSTRRESRDFMDNPRAGHGHVAIPRSRSGPTRPP
jgi:hypothetical protein